MRVFGPLVAVFAWLAGVVSVGGCRSTHLDWMVDDSQPVAINDIPVETMPHQRIERPPVEPPAVVHEVPPVRVNTYTIRRGDTLWSIARRTYGDGKRWQEIVAANERLDPTRLRVGQKIILP